MPNCIRKPGEPNLETRVSCDPTFLSENQFKVAWDINNTVGWNYELSGATEQLVDQAGYVSSIAGGYLASSHYARIRRRMPETDGFATTGAFCAYAEFILPSDFYTRQESYLRIITLSNFAGPLGGANDVDEWRVGFTIYGSDQLFRLTSDHQNNSDLVLWTNDQQLSTDVLHKVELCMDPSQTDGAWMLCIDGTIVGSASGVPTAPPSLDPSEIIITRAIVGIDGAADQTSTDVQVDLYAFEFIAEI